MAPGEQRDEVEAFQLIELHSIPASQGRRQDIELATSSQRVASASARLLMRRAGLSPAPFNRVALMTKRLRMLTTDAIGPKP